MEEWCAMARRPDHAAASRMLRIPRVELQRAAQEHGEHHFGFRRRAAGMPALRRVYGGEHESTGGAAELRDAGFVDLRQRLEGGAAQVEIRATFGAVLETFGLGGGEGVIASCVQQVESGGGS